MRVVTGMQQNAAPEGGGGGTQKPRVHRGCGAGRRGQWAFAVRAWLEQGAEAGVQSADGSDAAGLNTGGHGRRAHARGETVVAQGCRGRILFIEQGRNGVRGASGD